MRHINETEKYSTSELQFCLAQNFKEKEMTAEDTAGNVQFAKTF